MVKQLSISKEIDLFTILYPPKNNDNNKPQPLASYNKNDFLFMQGDLAREIYLVTEGKVKLSYYDTDGNEQVMAFVGRGELIGEMALLGQTHYREFAQVMCDRTRICKLRVERAQELVSDYSPFSSTLTKCLSDKVQKLERRLQILLIKDARHRLVEFIKDLCDDIGKPYRTGTKIELEITQSDIASLIGASRKTVSLLFTDLENEGLVKFFGRKEIYIANPSKLI